MATQEVLIEFIPDVSKVETALDQLTKSGKTDAETAESFKKTNAEIDKEAKALEKLSGAYQKFNNNLKNTSKAVISSGIADALKQAGVQATELVDELNASGVSIEKLGQILAEAGVEFDKTTSDTEQLTNSSITLKKELRLLNEEIAQAVVRGENFGDEFDALVAKAGSLRDSIDEANAVIKDAASDTKGFDNLLGTVQTLAAGFAIVQGAAGLFGDESEELQKTLLRVNSAMAILQGLQQVQAALQRDGAITLAVLNARQKVAVIQTNLETAAQSKNIVVKKLATAAQWALNAAMSANPIGLLVTLLAAVATALVIYTRNSREAAEATGELQGAVKNLTDELDKSVAAINRNAEREIIDLERVGAKQSEITGVKIAALRNEILANEEAYRRNKAIFDKGLGDEEKRLELKKELDSTSSKNTDLRIALQRLQLEQERQIAEEQKAILEERKRQLEAAQEAEKRRIADAIARLKTEQLALDENSSAYIRLERAIISLQARYDSIGQSVDQATFTLAKGAKDVANTTQELIGTSIEEIQKQYGIAIPKLVKDVEDVNLAIQDVGRITSEVVSGALDSLETDFDNFIENVLPRIAEGLGALQSISQGLNAISQERQQNQQIEIENQRNQVDALLEAGAITEREAIQRQRRIDQEEKRQQLEAARRNKQLAIFQAVISTAQAVVNALATPPAPVGIALAAVVGALGAAQVAAISARPLPKFYKGKTDNYEGFGIVGDAGAELIQRRDGSMWIAPKEMITYLDSKDKVFTAAQTRAMLPKVDKSVMKEVKTEKFEIDYSKLAALMPKPTHTEINIDRDFISESVANGLSRINYMDKRYSSK